MEVKTIISDFKEIMEKYPKAMNEDQKGHPLANKMRNDFKYDLKSLVESISDSSFNFRISPGRMGRWANPPWAGIISSTLPDKFTDGLYVIYHFNYEKNIIDLSINQGLDNIKRSEAINIAKKLRKNADLIDGFSLEDDPDFRNSQTAVLYKKYDIDNIDSEIFFNDLKNLLKVYEKLLPYYNEILNTYNETVEDLSMDNKINYWLYAPGNRASKWDDYYEKGIMGMGSDNIGDLHQYESKERIVKKLQRVNHTRSKYPNDSLALWQFANEIKQGDIIFVKKGAHEIVGYGIVQSEYFYDTTLDDEIFCHMIRVDWKEKGNWKYNGTLATKTLTKITNSTDLLNTLCNYFETSPKTYEFTDTSNIEKDNKANYGGNMRDNDYGLLNVNERNIWKITPGSVEVRDDVWSECKEKGFISIGYSKNNIIDYSNYASVDELREVLLNINSDKTESSTAPQMIWNFVNEIKINDIVVANNGLNGKVYGIGVVESDYIAPDNLDIKIDSTMKHIRKIKWIISDEFNTEVTFDRKTITKLNDEKWNLIVKALLNLDNNLKIESLKCIFDEFVNTYYNTSQSEELRSKYSDCTEKFRSDFENIKISINDGYDETDHIFYNLIDPNDSLFKGFASDKKQMIKKSFNRSEDELSQIAAMYLNLIDNYNKSDEDLRHAIFKFDDNELTKSIKTAYVSASLYFLDNNRFYTINQKTINTIKFLSNYVDIHITFDNKLNTYIDNNLKYHDYVNEIAKYLPELNTFERFDHFCHWLCDKKLGYYGTSGKLPLCIKNFKEKKIAPEIYETKAFNINPINIQTSLTINEKVLYQTAAILNSPKNIIFEGVPGTGKTRLAMDICEYAKEENFCDDYLITTATSDWTTFDVIGGLMPDTNGNLNFEEGIFLKAIRENKLLIIDEINRADIDKAFGQLFTVLSGSPVKLNYKIDENNISIDHTDKLESYYDNSSKTYFIGKNFRILATMNNYDKDSLYELSYAFMRRFAFVELDIPNEEDFNNLIDMWNDELLVSLPSELIDDIKQLLGIRYYRKLGPAIFYDMINYMVNRLKLDSTDYLLEECILLYILPQFEGLSRNKLADIKNLLVNNNLVREEIVTEKFNELGGLNF